VTGLRVLMTCPPALASASEYIDRLGEQGIEVVCAEVVQSLSEDDLIAVIGGFDAIVAGDDPLSARVLDHADRLRLIARWGVGMDNVDMAAAEAHGIQVVNTPGAFTNEVADVAIGYLVLLSRNLHRVDAAVRAGHWAKPAGRSLAGRTLGIVGLGSIGRAVARRAMAMEMSVAGTDVSRDAAAAAEDEGVLLTDFAGLLERSEVLVLCSSLTDGNRHLIDRAAIAQMRPGAWLINVARGGLVDERALVAALGDGRIGAAALDVFEVEPLPPDSPLRSFEQVVLGSHNASNTRDAVGRVNDLVIANVLRALGEVTA
jgi:phosphoglycerate dehydrogenase-like enzyme